MERSTVRYVTKRDELAIFDFICLGHADNGLWPISHKKILDLVIAACNVHIPENGTKPTIGIIEGENGIEAMTCFTLDTMWYTDAWHIAEIFNYVHPDYRASKHADALLAFQKKFTDDMSTVTGQSMALITGVMTRKRLEAKMHLFQRKYPQIGAIFAYNIGEHLPDDQFNQRRLMQ